MGQIAINHQVVLEQMDCGTCGVTFAIPAEMYNNAKRLGGWWHCPNGHCRGWEKGSEHTRIKELEAALQSERERKLKFLDRVRPPTQSAPSKTDFA